VLAILLWLFVPEDEETIVLCNVRNHSTHDTVQTRRTESSPGYQYQRKNRNILPLLGLS
jgi:hypothetical protein